MQFALCAVVVPPRKKALIACCAVFITLTPCMDSVWVFPPTIQGHVSGDRSIGHSNLPIGVTWECVWLSVSTCQPCDDLAICPGCTLPLAQCQLGEAPTVLQAVG